MTICRRQGMAGGAALAAALAAGPLMARSLRAKPIGIQLYTVRELFAKDPAGTLEKVAEIGYREVETIATTRRSEEHTSELQSLMRISYAVFCLKKKKTQIKTNHNIED